MSVGGRGTRDEEIISAYRFSGKGITDEEILGQHKFSGAASKQEYGVFFGSGFSASGGSGGGGYIPSAKPRMNTRIYYDLSKASDFALGLEAGGIKNISIVKVEDHWEVRYA